MYKYSAPVPDNKLFTQYIDVVKPTYVSYTVTELTIDLGAVGDCDKEVSSSEG